MLITQTRFPPGGPAWLHAAPDHSGFEKPATTPVEHEIPNTPILEIIGTVRNECIPFMRSWDIWSRQTALKDWYVRFWILDDGSNDGLDAVVKQLQQEGAPIRYARFRDAGDPQERSCTLLLNAIVKHYIRAPLCMIQWWDRIPGHFEHLRQLLLPHFFQTNIMTSAISRHIGGSSSVETMTPGELRALLSSVEWHSDPEQLNLISGPIGGHCKPIMATESSGFIFQVEDFIALGGYDERYQTRAGYSNVELFRRMLQAGYEVKFVKEPVGANYHQSHACPTNREKTTGWLSDGRIVRNPDGWGNLEPIEIW